MECPNPDEQENLEYGNTDSFIISGVKNPEPMLSGSNDFKVFKRNQDKLTIEPTSDEPFDIMALEFIVRGVRAVNIKLFGPNRKNTVKVSSLIYNK